MIAIAQEGNNKYVCYVYNVIGDRLCLLYKEEYNRPLYNRFIYYRTFAYTLFDYDGDGVNDIMVPTITINEPYYSELTFKKLRAPETEPCSIVVPLSGQKNIPIYTFGDLYGKGSSSVIVVETTMRDKSQNEYRVLYNSHRSEKSDVSVNFHLPSKLKQTFCSDYNGDGMSDILVTHEGGYIVLWNKGDGVFGEDNKYTSTAFGDYDVMRMGDFNGDGYADFVCNDRGSDIIDFLLSNGDGSFTRSTAISNLNIGDKSFTGYDDNKFSMEVMDFNGDGKSDVVVTKSDYKKKHDISGSWGSFLKTYTYWLQSDGSGLSLKNTATSVRSEDGLSNRFVTGDFDGDGQTEMLYYGYDCHNSTDANEEPTWRMYDNGVTPETNRVRKIAGKNWLNIDIQYSTIAGNKQLYEKSSETVGSAVNMTVPLSVVSSVTEDRGAAGKITKEYSYAGLRVHMQGRGLLGFSSLSERNVTLGESRRRTVWKWNSECYVPTEIETCQTVGDETAKEVTIMSVSGKGRKRYWAHVDRISQTDYDKNVITTENTYSTDNYQLTSQKTRYSDGAYKSIEYSNFVKAGGEYKPRQVTQKQKHGDDNAEFTQTDKYTYDTANGDVLSHKHYYDKEDRGTTTTYKYDVRGNVTYEETVSSDGALPAVEYKYDKTKRFVVKATSTVGTTESTYDAFDNLLTQTDLTDPENPLKTSYKYDGFGRVVSQTDAAGVETKTKREQYGSNKKKYSVRTEREGAAPVTTYYDNCGREVLTETVGEKGVRIVTEKTYDKYGLLASEKNTTGGLVLTQDYTYDRRGRLLTSVGSNGRMFRYTYGNRTVTEKDEGHRGETVTTYDSWGNPKEIKDRMETVTTYKYSSCGKPKEVTCCGAKWIMEYDAGGNRTSLKDPDAGVTKTKYDAFGRVKESKNARGITTKYTYDARGNMAERVCQDESGDEGEHSYFSYDEHGRVSEEWNDDATKMYEYDKYGQLTSETLSASSASLTTTYAYDNNGHLTKATYPNGLEVSYTYDANGYQTEVYVDTACVWRREQYTGLSSTAKILYGKTETTLNADGRLESKTYTADKKQTRILAGSQVDITVGYTYSRGTENILSKTVTRSSSDVVTKDVEDYHYDRLNRLLWVTTDKDKTQMEYGNNGNILKKTRENKERYGNRWRSIEYKYEGERPHAVTTAWLSNDIKWHETQNIVYTPFNKVSQVEEIVDGSRARLTIKYGPDRQRVSADLNVGGTRRELRHYMGEYEQVTYEGGKKANTLYVYSPDGLVCVCVNKAKYNVFTDHLGSILSMQSRSSEVYRATYDAWGEQTVKKNNLWRFHRGFCMHEHWPEFGLIDMNGRFYDPVLGRFLSPDPYVQDPTFSQNFNRYSYCMNNPVRYTDPSGEFWHIVIGAVVGGVANLAMGLHSGKVDNFGKGAAYFGVGALAGAASAAVGGGVSSAIGGGGFWAGAGGTSMYSASSCFVNGAAVGVASGAVSGLINSSGNAWLEGASFGGGLKVGFIGGATGGASGALTTGLAGGFSAMIDGRNFMHGGREINLAISDSPQMHQRGLYDCRYETFRSIDMCRNGSTDDVATLRILFDCVEENDSQMGSMYSSKYYKLLDITNNIKSMSTVDKANYLISEMGNNNSVIGEIYISKGMGHSVVIRTVKVYDNGHVLIKVMNPSGAGGMVFRSFKKFYRFFAVIKIGSNE